MSERIIVRVDPRKPSAPRRVVLDISQIRVDGDTQSRAEINRAAVGEYAADMKEGQRFPACEVIQDEQKTYWLWDGFHRYEAAVLAGEKKLECVVRRGTVEEARLLAAGANTTHGLRRTNEDKRRAVEMTLMVKPDWSDRAIAEHCGVSHPFVASVRGSLVTVTSQPAAPATRTGRERLSDSDSQPAVRTGRDGRAIDTANIGRKKSAKARPAPEGEPEGEQEKQQDEPAREPAPAPTKEQLKRGKGIVLAHEAINCLRRIPKNDCHRKAGFKIVADWLRRNPIV